MHYILKLGPTVVSRVLWGINNNAAFFVYDGALTIRSVSMGMLI